MTTTKRYGVYFFDGTPDGQYLFVENTTFTVKPLARFAKMSPNQLVGFESFKDALQLLNTVAVDLAICFGVAPEAEFLHIKKISVDESNLSNIAHVERIKIASMKLIEANVQKTRVPSVYEPIILPYTNYEPVILPYAKQRKRTLYERFKYWLKHN